MIAVGDIETGSINESNLLLRALWAHMRTRFGILGWQYTPKRDGPKQSIRFGWATLGASAPTGIEISIHYKHRGIIDSIRFEPRGHIYDLHPDLDPILRECVKEATAAIRSPAKFRLAAKMFSAPAGPVGLYFSERWHIGPLDDGSTEIGLTVEAFDEVDSLYEFEVRVGLLLDALAVWTNCVFQRADHSDDNSCTLDLPDGILWGDPEWLEHHPIAENLVRLDAIQLALGDEIVSGLMNGNDRLARASRLFHEGLILYHSGSQQFYDMATILFVSALEVVSLTDNATPTCSNCGQPLYKISKRVSELGVSHLGEGARWVFDNHYRRRSRYLHSGALHYPQPGYGYAIPQLDPEAPEGSAMPRSIGFPKNLMEFTSFIIRAEMRAHMVASVSSSVI